MATTSTTKKTTGKTSAKSTTTRKPSSAKVTAPIVEEVDDVIINDTEEIVFEDTATAVEEPVEKETVKEVIKYVVKEEPVKNEPRTFKSTDLILCRSVCPGWLGMSASKSGNYYVWENIGDYCEVEYQDLFAYKSRKSAYLYDPLIVIEDDELLANPRWQDLMDFYEEEVYGKDDIEAILNLPNTSFKNSLRGISKGLKKALCLEVSERIAAGTFDSINKVKAIDEICGTDFSSILLA